MDRSLERTLGTRFKLGMFDPPEDVPFASISMDVVACPKHRQLAYQTAAESVVLLKNKNNILPIKPKTKKIFLTGPTATSLEVSTRQLLRFQQRDEHHSGRCHRTSP